MKKILCLFYTFILVACGSSSSSSPSEEDEIVSTFSSSEEISSQVISSSTIIESSSSFFLEKMSSDLNVSSSQEYVVSSSSDDQIPSGPKTKEEYYALYDDEDVYTIVCGKNAFAIMGTDCLNKYSKCAVNKKGAGQKYCASWTGEGCPAGTYHSSGCVNSTCTNWQTVYSYDTSLVVSNPFCEYIVLPDYVAGMKCGENGDLVKNEVTKEILVCDDGFLRNVTDLELLLDLACTSNNRFEEVGYKDFSYECRENGWGLLLLQDVYVDERDGHSYRTVNVNGQIWMYDNLVFEVDSSWCSSEKDCESNGRLYTWSAAMDLPKECNKTLCHSYLEQGACPDGWVVPDTSQLKSLYNYAKKNDVYDQINIPKGNTIQLWSRNYSAAAKAFQMYNQENTTMKMSMISEPKSKGVYVKCLQSTSDIELNPYNYEKMVDERDGNEYRIISIGGQTWMAENLRYDPGESRSLCYHNKDSYCEKYGRLYTWYTVMGGLPVKESGYVDPEYIDQPHQGICPDNWHVPTDSEWIELRDFVGNSGASLKSTFGWGNEGNGTDIYHFRALPAGYSGAEYSTDEVFHGIGAGAYFHTTKQITVNSVYVGSLTNAYATVGSGDFLKSKGASVRCVKNKPQESD